MRRKIFAIILSISVMFSQAVPAFAENLDDTENGIVMKQTSEADEGSGTLSVLAETDEAAFFESGDGDMDEKNEIPKEAESEGESTQLSAVGESISNATDILIGSPCSGSITDSNTEDFYRFTLSSSGKITLTATASISCVNYRIYDSTGERLWSDAYFANSSGQSSIDEVFDLTKGTYYLGVEQYGSNTGNYSFKITFASAGESFTETGNGNNNTIAEASSISIGTTYRGQIAKNDEKDFYKFTIGSSGKVTLTSTVAISGIYCRIYDSMGERLWDDGWYSANSSGQCSINKVLDLTKGTYYLGIEQRSGTGNYSFKLAFVSAGESFTEIGNGNNNTIATANSISTGVTYRGQIAENDDKDFYKFTISSSGKVALTSTVAISGIYCRIYDSMGERLWDGWYSANSSGQCSINKVLDLTKGTYYLGIEQRSGTGNYSFKIAPHSHNYVSKVMKATTSQNGKIEYECACGATKQSIIYYPKNISLSATKYIYDGKAKKPSVTVKGSNGKVISSSNYTLKYSSGRKNVGKYTVKITFKGNYSGSVTKTFVINPPATSLSKLTAKSKGFTVKWKKRTTQVTGYQIQYSTSKSFSGKITKTISKNSTASETYKGLNAKKKYYVRVRTYRNVSGTKYYSSWSSAKTVTTKK